MNVLTTAQAFGFGPAAKLVNVTEQLSAEFSMHFAGHDSALRYVRLNDSSFTGIIEADLGDIRRARELVKKVDGVISVMDPVLVFAAVREGRPAYFLDSLLGFWLLERPIAELVLQAEVVRTGSDQAVDQLLHSLPVHESMILAHVLATQSFAQAFREVGERIEALRRHGITSVTATGPMTNLEVIEPLRLGTPKHPGTLVVNLGGFQNPFLSGDRRGGYIDLVLRWLRRLAERTTVLSEIVVCSGAFTSGTIEENYGGVRIRIGMLTHRALLTQVASCAAYLSPPGLTSLHEAIALDVPLMLLPEQHYGHVHNRLNLRGTAMADHAASFAYFDLDLDLDRDVPEDDLKGTLAIAAIAESICADDVLFDRFADYMDGRLLDFMSLRSPRAYVDELRGMLDGPTMDAALAAIAKGMRSAAGVSS